VTARARRDDLWTYAGLALILLFFGIPLVWLISLFAGGAGGRSRGAWW